MYPEFSHFGNSCKKAMIVLDGVSGGKVFFYIRICPLDLLVRTYCCMSALEEFIIRHIVLHFGIDAAYLCCYFSFSHLQVISDDKDHLILT